MDDYNGFSEKERNKYDKLQNKAIEEGLLKPTKEVKCIICGQDK